MTLSLRTVEPRTVQPPPIDPAPDVVQSADAGEAFGIYVHFPWCLSKCPYCDFASRAGDRIPHGDYASAVLAELDLRAGQFPRRRVTSVFFGGGTPSLWDPTEVGRVVETLRRRFDVDADAEWTLEANPGASDAVRFGAYRALGFNRLSIGAQSFDPQVLRSLGRQHSPDDVARAVAAAREAGFARISVDLIYGAPGHTVESVRRDVQTAVALGTDHLSAYALTLEHLAEPVPMQRDVQIGRVTVPDGDAQADMGEVVRAELAAAGFERYEISNYARNPSQRCRHNLLYWQGGGYIGLGVGASGFVRASSVGPGRRYSNKRSPEHYLEAVGRGWLPEKEAERVERADVLLERLYTGLRLVDGVSMDDLRQLGGVGWVASCHPLLERWERDGFVRQHRGMLSLTDRGMELHTELAGRLVDAGGVQPG